MTSFSKRNRDSLDSRAKQYYRFLKRQNTCNRLSKLDPGNYKAVLSRWYKAKTGFDLNLDNPATLNEKLQWLKLHDSTPIKGHLADKYLVRSWIEEHMGKGHLAPLIGVWDNAEQIDFSLLPEKFVLKTTHGSGWNVIVPDKNDLDISRAKKWLNRWLKLNYAFISEALELHYQYCKPKIIAEEYLEFPVTGPIDYRFYCSRGNVFSVWEDIGSGTPSHKRNIYSPDWQLQNACAKWPSFTSTGKPALFEEMLRYASLLSKDFIFVRVDFYEYKDTVYFGEMTFTPMQGAAPYNPAEFDLFLGSKVVLPW